MNRTININIESFAPKELLPFLMVLNSHSENNFIVGGAVRDIMSQKTPKDWDIVTDIPMDKLIELFEEGGFTVKQTGVAHFVLNVYFGGYEVEVSNFRKDIVCNGRQAEVEVGTIHDDAHRRDFTINSLYCNTYTGIVVDPTGQGIDDVLNKTLRFVGKPKERIREDYLRVWRAFRLQKKLNFVFDKKTERSLREMFAEAYENSNPQRVLHELIKLSES